MDQTMVISEREFLQLCERLLFYVPNLSKEFRFFCKEMGAAKGQKHKLKLTYGECTLLLNKIKFVRQASRRCDMEGVLQECDHN